VEFYHSGDYGLPASSMSQPPLRRSVDRYSTRGKRRCAAAGGQPDDVIVVTFDLPHGSAELRFGDETEDTKETNADVGAPISLVATALSEDRRTPLITGIELTGGDKEWDLTGSHKEWQPIATAPVEQDLEVRLEDFVGRYVLLFPCRLVPGQGWINSRLETPLPADPIDRRNWDESSLRF
jgi:hypothetical protein